jgi:hypothetical protein
MTSRGVYRNPLEFELLGEPNRGSVVPFPDWYVAVAAFVLDVRM